MSELGRGRGRVLAVVAFLLGAVLLLSCQPAQPAATPQAGTTPAGKATEKPAATVAPTKAAAEKPVKGGTLRVSNYNDPLSLDGPAVTAQRPANSIFDLLIEPDNDGNPSKEGLAKDWTISPDGKTITFKLQSGVKFHDGTDFDAAAVKWNIDRMKDPNFKSPYLSNYLAVTSVEVVDPLTVRFNLKQPDPILLIRLTTQGGMMASPTAAQKLGQDFGRKPVGTGPFQIVEWIPSDHITVKRFDGYWRKDKDGVQLPYLDQVIMPIITDPTVAFANLRSGQMDVYYYAAYGFPPEQFPVLKADPNLTYISAPGSGYHHVRFQTQKPPTDNKALRQAIALAVDREGMATVLGQTAKPWASPFHPINWGVDPVKGVFPNRDVAKAKAKLVEAGYPGGGGLKLELMAGGTTPAHTKLAEIMQANLKEIGIESNILVLAASAMLEKRDLQLDFQIAMGGTPIQLPDPGHVWGLMMHSKGTRAYFAYNNPKVDELIDKAGSIYDQKERTALYQQAAEIMVDDAPFVPTAVEETIMAMNKKVRNFPMDPARTVGYDETWLTK